VKVEEGGKVGVITKKRKAEGDGGKEGGIEGGKEKETRPMALLHVKRGEGGGGGGGGGGGRQEAKKVLKKKKVEG